MPFLQTPLGYVTRGISVGTTVINIDDDGFGWGANDLFEAERAIITARATGVVVSWTGEPPTATLGYLIPKDGNLTIEGNANILNLKFVKESGPNCDLSVTLEK